MSRVTGAQRHDELYDEIERLAEQLTDMFDMDRTYDEVDGERKRRIDPEFLINRAAALNDAALELKFLRKFRGSLRIVED